MESFRNWEDLQDLIQCGALKESEVERSLEEILRTTNSEVVKNEEGELSLNMLQFTLLLDAIQNNIDISQANEALLKKTTDEIEDMMKEIVNTKKSNQKEQLQELIKQDFETLREQRRKNRETTPTSTLVEDASQRKQSISKQKEKVRQDSLSTNQAITQIMQDVSEDKDLELEDDEDIFVDSDSERTSELFMEQQEAKEIFQSLLPLEANEKLRNNRQISLKTFVEWSEVQSLLTMEILTEEIVASTLSGLLKLDKENSPIMSLKDARLCDFAVDFQQFFDLLSVLTSHIDQNKLQHELKLAGMDSFEVITPYEIQAQEQSDFNPSGRKQFVSNKNNNNKAERSNSKENTSEPTANLKKDMKTFNSDDTEDDELWQGLFEGLPTDAEDEEDLQRMFLELLSQESERSVATTPSQGTNGPLSPEEVSRVSTGAISLSTLSNWSELKELVAASMLSREEVTNLIHAFEKQLSRPGKIHFDEFQTFMKMLDEHLANLLDDSTGMDADDDDKDDIFDDELEMAL